jgi:hypothetical protein
LLLKGDPTRRSIVTPSIGPGEDDRFVAVRCPQCGWRRSDSSSWSCDPSDGPEPPFRGCGTAWNTFTTRGRCPGCAHQWQWTSCLRCEQWSLHEDWYDEQ